MKLRWLVVGMLLATSHELAAKPDGTCIAEGRLGGVALDGGRVKYCFSGAKIACYTTELDSGIVAIAPAPATLDETNPKGPAVTVNGEDVTVCHADGTACKTLKPTTAIDPGMGMTAAANEAGTLAAVTAGGLVDLFDLKTGKLVTTVNPPPTGMCNNVSYVGDVLAISSSECGTTKSMTYLVSRTGKRIATVGNNKPIHASTYYVHVAEDRWAFSSTEGDTVVIQDLKNGKIRRRIATGAAPEERDFVAMVGTGSRLVMVHGGSRAGDVSMIDATSGKVRHFAGQRCAP